MITVTDFAIIYPRGVKLFVSAINSVKFFNNYFNKTSDKKFYLFENNHDVFIKKNSINFESTSAGAPLRRLKNITDPYFGEKMISVADMPKIEKRLDECSTVKKTVHVLQKYKKNMQPIELKIFERIEAASQSAVRKTLPQLLNMWYDESLINLKLEEFRIIDTIDALSQQLSPETELKIREKTTKCRQSLVDGSAEAPFKRKSIIASIAEIQPKTGEEEVLDNLKNYSFKLPSSSTSENAFIVKYADRSHEEIAKRLIRLSVGTVEHIKPDSLGGENDISNFMLVSAQANSLRGNMPLSDFIKRFPQVLKNVQIYIEDIINTIHKGGLQGNQSYPYKVKQTLRKESEGIINLNLSSFKYSAKEARKLEKNSKSSYSHISNKHKKAKRK